jgi:hypothetical protein
MTKKPDAPAPSSPSPAAAAPSSRPLSQMVEVTSKRVKVDEDNYDRFAKRPQTIARAASGSEPPAPEVAPAPSATPPPSATAEAEALSAARADLASFDAGANADGETARRARRTSKISASIAAIEPELGPSGLQPPPPELPPLPPGAAGPDDVDEVAAAHGGAEPAPEPRLSAPGIAVPPVDAADLATPGGTMMLVGFSAPGIAVPPVDAAPPSAAPDAAAPSQGTMMLAPNYSAPGIAAQAPAPHLGGDDLIGRELAGYVVKEKLAEGGMGVVYLGEHTKIGRKSAIKVLKLDYCTSTEVVERFLQEARSVNEIRHENIVDIYDFGRDSAGRAFFVMELLEGERCPSGSSVARCPGTRRCRSSSRPCARWPPPTPRASPTATSSPTTSGLARGAAAARRPSCSTSASPSCAARAARTARRRTSSPRPAP